MPRKFKVGDRVCFELSDSGLPRWNHGKDCGGSGRWDTGVVVEDGGEWFDITCDSSGSVWNWLQPGSISDEYWEQPGYIKLADLETIADPQPTCRDLCDLTTIMRGDGHDPRCPEGRTYSKHQHGRL